MFRGRNVLVSPVPSGFFGKSLAVRNQHTKQSLPCPYTGIRIPLVPRGLRSALIRHTWSHDEMSGIVILLFFTAKALKIDVVIRDLFVVNRDIKNRDSRYEDHESRFFRWE